MGVTHVARNDGRLAFPMVIGLVEPPAGIEPATPSLPWNHQEPLCGPPFPQLAPDRRCQSYRFSYGEVSESLKRQIFKMQQVRHLWAHRGGRPDEAFRSRCPWMHPDSSGKIRVGMKRLNGYGAATCSMQLRLRIAPCGNMGLRIGREDFTRFSNAP
jgi:hypothetical protein